MSEIIGPGGDGEGLIDLAQKRAERVDWDNMIRVGIPRNGYLGELLCYVSEQTGVPLNRLAGDILIRGSKSFAASLEGKQVVARDLVTGEEEILCEAPLR